MTIEEYDSKKRIRDAIECIEKALHSISETVEENNKFGIVFWNSRWLCASNICNVIEDPVIAEGIKQLLIERKKELVEEFSK